MDFQGKNILVVGASGVLGSAFAEQLLAAGARVLGTASSTESAQRIPQAVQLKLLLDLESDDSVATLANYINAHEKLDGIVLAAGRVGFGRLADTTAHDLSRITRINFLAQADLVSRITPALQPEGFVAAITGVVAEKAFPGMAAYCASKSALSAWLGGAALELRRQGVKVVELRPGHTETGLATRPLFGEAPAMPQGMDPAHVASVTIAAIAARTLLVSSAEF